MYRNCLKYLFLFAVFYIGPVREILSQNSPSDADIVISGILEEAVASTDEESDLSTISEEMIYFLDHPLNLNSASTEELRQLNLLTEFQIYSLMAFIHDEGELLSIYELQLVYGFDRQLITKLLPFIVVAPGNNSGGNNPIQKKFGQRLILRAGFNGNNTSNNISDKSENTIYNGANRSLLLRYEAKISKYNFGLTAEQDAGESFTSPGKEFCPDFISGFLEYKNNGLIKKIVIGDYKASWGQGLILGGYGTRKGSQVLLSPPATGIKKYSSAGENNFFRGIATGIGWRNISLELLASHLKIDAAIQNQSSDSTIANFFSSPDITGLHRNNNELGKKDAVICNNFGAHAQIRKGNIVTGFSYLNQQYDNYWIRNKTAYSQEIYPGGTCIQNIGTDIKASLGRLAVFSEIAMDTKARAAVFAGILADLHPLVKLSMVYRNYQPAYLGLKSAGFGESQGTKNEEGFYLGIQIYPHKYLKADLYADHYNFPFLRYNSTNPYSGNDYLLNLTCVPSREFSVNMRFRYEKNQNRSTTSITGIDRMQTAQKGGYRVELNYEMNKNLKLKSRLEFSYFRNAQNPVTTGFYSGHDVNIQTTSQKYKLWLRYAIYDIPGWDNRIYAYENDVLYSFSVPAFNSKGARFIIMGKAEIFRGLDISIRYALSQFQESKSDGTKASAEGYWTIQMYFKQ